MQLRKPFIVDLNIKEIIDFGLADDLLGTTVDMIERYMGNILRLSYISEWASPQDVFHQLQEVRDVCIVLHQAYVTALAQAEKLLADTNKRYADMEREQTGKAVKQG